MTPPKILYSFIEGQQRFSCDGIEIVNREMLIGECLVLEAGTTYWLRVNDKSSLLKHGDQFPLPNGLELRELSDCPKVECGFFICEYPEKCHSNKLFRIVRTEAKPESQENMMQELLQEYRNLRKRKATSFSIALALLDKFTIQRKKP